MDGVASCVASLSVALVSQHLHNLLFWINLNPEPPYYCEISEDTAVLCTTAISSIVYIGRVCYTVVHVM